MTDYVEAKETDESVNEKFKKMYAPTNEDSEPLSTIKKEISVVLDKPYQGKDLTELQKLKAHYNRLHSDNISKREKIKSLKHFSHQLEEASIAELSLNAFPTYRELNNQETTLISEEVISEIIRNKKAGKSQSFINKTIATGFPSIDELATQLEEKKKEITETEQMLQNELHYTEIYQNMIEKDKIRLVILKQKTEKIRPSHEMSSFSIDKLNRFKYVAENREKVTKNKIRAFEEELNEIKNNQFVKITQRNRSIEQNTKGTIKKLEQQQKEINVNKTALDELKREKERNAKLEGDVEAILEHINPHKILHLFDGFDIITKHFLRPYNYTEMESPIIFIEIKEINTLFESMRNSKINMHRTEQEDKDDLKKRISIFQLDGNAIIEKYKQNIITQKVQQSRFDELNKIKLAKLEELNHLSTRVLSIREIDKRMRNPTKEIQEKSINLESQRLKSLQESNEAKRVYVAEWEMNIKSLYSSIYLMCQYTSNLAQRLFKDNAALLNAMKGVQSVLPLLTELNSSASSIINKCFISNKKEETIHSIEKYLDCKVVIDKFEEYVKEFCTQNGNNEASLRKLNDNFGAIITTLLNLKFETYNSLLEGMNTFLSKCISMKQKAQLDTTENLKPINRLKAMQISEITDEEKAKIRLRKEKCNVVKRMRSEKKSERLRETVDEANEFIKEARDKIKNNRLSETIDAKTSETEVLQEPNDMWFRKNLTKYCNFENNGIIVNRANVLI